MLLVEGVLLLGAILPVLMIGDRRHGRSTITTMNAGFVFVVMKPVDVGSPFWAATKVSAITNAIRACAIPVVSVGQ